MPCTVRGTLGLICKDQAADVKSAHDQSWLAHRISRDNPYREWHRAINETAGDRTQPGVLS